MKELEYDYNYIMGHTDTMNKEKYQYNRGKETHLRCRTRDIHIETEKNELLKGKVYSLQ